MIKSKRLQKIYDIMPNIDVVIDVGCDHGYLEELLILSGKVKKVIAVDISAKSLQKTQIRADKLGILDKIELINADGLSFKSQSKSNFAIIAGIGGVETVNILKENKSSVNEFILVPVQNGVYVREYLMTNGYQVVHDETIFEKGKYYNIIYCKKADKTNIKSKYFGNTDLENRGEDFERFINRELSNLAFLDKVDEVLQEKREYRKLLLKLKGE